MKKIFIPLLLLSVIIAGVVFMGTDEEALPVLSNPQAGESAKKLYGYICSLEGTATLSAQQESTWMGSADYETDYIYDISGKYPAIKGFDYMNDDFEGVNRRAEEWHKKGGIVTICWHCGSDFSGEWKDCKETDITDWEKALTAGTKEYDALIEGMDKGARALSELCQKDIPVLWRPFHEFDGDWFWWSRGGSECFIKLWRIMYERYTEVWGLDNLIWVAGFSHKMQENKKWYPGDSFCDIIGGDTYDIEINKKLYRKIRGITKAPKPVCLHECSTMPTAEEMEKYPWAFFMTWHTEYLTDNNSKESIKDIYCSDFVITLDEVEKLQ